MAPAAAPQLDHAALVLATVPLGLVGAPFTTERAREAGLTARQLQSPPWVQLLRGVYVHQSVEITRKVRAQAAASAFGPAGFFCGPTASWLFGVDIAKRPEDPHESLWVAHSPDHRLRHRPDWRIKQVVVAPQDLIRRNGARLTTPMRTAFDCTRWLAVHQAVMVVDSFANRGKITFAGLEAYAAGQPARFGSPRLGQVLTLADAGAESPMETLTRLTIAPAGLSVRTQIDVLDREGNFLGRLDMGDETLKVAVEYDGICHQTQRQADDRRRDAIRNQGWEVVVAGWSDIYLDGGQRLIERVGQAVERQRRKLR